MGLAYKGIITPALVTHSEHKCVKLLAMTFDLIDLFNISNFNLQQHMIEPFGII